MPMPNIWKMILGVEEKTVVEYVDFNWETGELIAHIRPNARWEKRPRCGICGRRCPGYDAGERRRWRTLDLGSVISYLEGEAPRVTCKKHGVVVAAVPWARHKSRFTKAFEDSVAWLATKSTKSAICELMRTTWRTVGRIIGRVMDEVSGKFDLFAGLKRIGIDEISHRKGHRYLTSVVDHDSGRLLWAAPGRDEKTLHAFFELLGPERCAAIEAVSADAASWIRNVVKERCPQATQCMDPFHVVSWATDALDEVRRQVWNDARSSGQTALAKELKGARYALWKNPEDLTRRQEAKLADIAKSNSALYRAYLLKEQLRQIYQLPADAAMELLDKWLKWARRCRLKPFVKLAKRITKHREHITASLRLKLSNGLVESMNTKIRLIIRRAFGFHSPEALIGLAMLDLGGLCPALPGRGRR